MFCCSRIKNYYKNPKIPGECAFRAFRGLKNRSFFNTSLDTKVNQKALEVFKKILFTVGVMTLGPLALIAGVLLKTISYPEHISETKTYLLEEYVFYDREYAILCKEQKEDMSNICEELEHYSKVVQAENKENYINLQSLGTPCLHAENSNFLEKIVKEKETRDENLSKFQTLLRTYPKIGRFKFSYKSVQSARESVHKIKSAYLARLEHHAKILAFYKARILKTSCDKKVINNLLRN